MRVLCTAIITACLLLLCMAASADEADFTWQEQGDGTVIITAWTGTGDQVTVPETLGGHEVSGIAKGVFANKPNLTITLPDGITNIDKNAFGSVLNGGIPRVLCNRTSTTAQHLSCQFYDPTNAEQVLRWQNGLLKLVRYEGEPGNVTVLSGVQYISDSVFEKIGDCCIILPESVTEISNYAFASTYKLTVYLPDHVTTFLNHTLPFGGNGQYYLAKIFCDPESETAALLNVPFRAPEAPACLLSWVDGTLTLTDIETDGGPVVLPSFEISIPPEVMNTLPCFTLPSDTVRIEAEAFRGCGENRIIVPAGVESIGAYAFADSPNLLMIRFPSGEISIDNTCLSNCPHVTVYAPAGSAALLWAQGWGLETVAE